MPDSDAERLADFAKGNAKARDSIEASARDGQQKKALPADESMMDIAEASRLADFVGHIGRMKQAISAW